MAIVARHVEKRLRGGILDAGLVRQTFIRRAAPMHWVKPNTTGFVLYTDFFPMFGHDCLSSRWEFQGTHSVLEGSPFFTVLRQYRPGFTALPLYATIAGLPQLAPVQLGVRVAVANRPALSHAARNAHGAVQLGLWGSINAADTITVLLDGTEWHTGRAQREQLTVTAANAEASNTLDLISPWVINVGTTENPIPRGWYGRWGVARSKLAWREIRGITPIVKTIDVTGKVHGFTQHPMKGFSAANMPTEGNAVYVPEIFLTCCEPMFHTPWPSAKLSELIAVRVIPGGTGLMDEWGSLPSGYTGSPFYQDGFSRKTPGQAGTDYFSLAPGVAPWVRDVNGQGPGDVWGLGNMDDTPNATPVGDAPKLHVGAIVEAWWDPGGR